jgi:N-acetylneuraminic acid mutarotase
MKLNIETSQWRKISSKGTIPSPRFGATSFYCNERIYMFGGIDHSQNPVNDVFELDPSDDFNNLEYQPIILQNP